MDDLLEVDLRRGQFRRLLDGEQPFDPTPPLRAVISLAGNDAIAFGADWYADSTARVLVPSEADLESEELQWVTLDYYVTDDRVQVVISGPDPFPDPILRQVLSSCTARLLEEDATDLDHFSDMAREVRSMAVGILSRRIGLIEASVRQALDDEQVTAADYQALRSYPQRLALVESLARQVSADKPVWESHRPRNHYSLIAEPVMPDFFFRDIAQVADEARQSVARMSGLLASQQVVLTQRQALEAQRFQRVITFVGAAVLVPGLVAGIFGANVGFRGRDGTSAFWAMLAFMLAGGLGSYALLRLIESGTWNWESHPKLRWLKQRSPKQRAQLLAAVAVVMFAVGLAVLLLGHGPKH